MAIATKPQALWRTPTPLWSALTDETVPERQQRLFRRPSILRFDTDDFMEEFMAVLGSDPTRMWQWQAQSETWREPAIPPQPVRFLPASNGQPPLDESVPIVLDGDDALSELKLYQPVHQRYYLVTASLVCRIHGMPDRVLDTSEQERAAFVMRRLYPKPEPPNWQNDYWPPAYNLEFCDEYAFVTTPSGNNVWQKVSVPEMLERHEEQSPMFGVPFADIDGYGRLVLAGLIATGKREEYVSAPPVADTVAALQDGSAPPTTNNSIPATDPRIALLRSQVINPWNSLIDIKTKAREQVADMIEARLRDGESDDIKVSIRKEIVDINEQIKIISGYILLDLADYLSKYVTNVWGAIEGTMGTPTAGAELALYNMLQTSQDDFSIEKLADALLTVTVPECRDDIEGAYDIIENSPDWPSNINFPLVFFPFADEKKDNIIESSVHDISPNDWDSMASALSQLEKMIDPLFLEEDGLEQYIEAALPDTLPARTPPLPLAAQLADQFTVAGGLDGPAWFVIRCVLERPLFDNPYCDPRERAIMSEPTVPFQLAGFFDSDAPARPIQIAFPLDISPGNLRKFDKNVALKLSDALCAQVERAKGLGFVDLVLYVLPWPFHKDLPDPQTGPCSKGQAFGMVCSLSIPIITICALILLIIIVNLLNVMFKWLPFFIDCFSILKPDGNNP